ncbi:MAG: AMP-binding protein [Clostridiales bacterium]|nr:AMP-binding protein [Clostridiales bacterium]
MFMHAGRVAYESMEGGEIRRVRYGELKQKIAAFTALLRYTRPELQDAYVGIDLANSPHFIIAFWAILQSGNRPYLINSFYPLRLRQKLIEKLDVRLVITKSLAYEDVPVLDPEDCDYMASRLPTYEPIWANEMAISSSLTGLEAKVCVFDGEAVANQVINATDSILRKNNWLMGRYRGQIKIIAILPFFHIYGVIVSYFWFAIFGRTIVFLQNNAPDTIRNAIKTHGVTHVFAPPILYHKLYKGIMSRLSQENEQRKQQFEKGQRIAYALQDIFPNLGLRLSRRLFREVIDATFGDSVRFMISGGAFIENNALRTINAIGYPLFNGYGTTETMITSVELEKRIRHRVSGSIGGPFDGVNYALTEEGTLSVRGNTICRKLLSFDSVTEEPDCIVTNDIARVEKGKYYIEGRKNDLFIGQNGENISPDSIEYELQIKNANDFSVLELRGKLCLLLEFNELYPSALIFKEVERIRADLQSIAYGLAVSEIYITYDKMTKENAVKASRALLRRMVAEGLIRLIPYAEIAGRHIDSGADDMPAADDSLLLFIQKSFREALDTETEIDIRANFFFDLGGTSLDYFVLMSKLTRAVDLQINLEQRNHLYTVLDIYRYLMEVL